MPNFLICYDISDPKRLSRVHRAALRHGMPVQYSVFLLRGSQGELADMMADIEQYIDETEDDVRAYTIAPNFDVECLGVSHWSEEVYVHETK